MFSYVAMKQNPFHNNQGGLWCQERWTGREASAGSRRGNGKEAGQVLGDFAAPDPAGIMWIYLPKGKLAWNLTKAKLTSQLHKGRDTVKKTVEVIMKQRMVATIALAEAKLNEIISPKEIIIILINLANLKTQATEQALSSKTYTQ